MHEQLDRGGPQPLYPTERLGMDRLSGGFGWQWYLMDGLHRVSGRTDAVQQDLDRFGTDLRFVGQPPGEVVRYDRLVDILVFHLVAREFKHGDPLEILFGL